MRGKGGSGHGVSDSLTGLVTRYYQGWYRDAAPSFCTTNRYNLTNGVAVVWLP